MSVEAHESASLDLEATLEFTDDEKRAIDQGAAQYQNPILQRRGAVIIDPNEVQGRTDEQVYELMLVRSRL